MFERFEPNLDGWHEVQVHAWDNDLMAYKEHGWKCWYWAHVHRCWATPYGRIYVVTLDCDPPVTCYARYLKVGDRYLHAINVTMPCEPDGTPLF